jgi:hypothetical protein
LLFPELFLSAAIPFCVNVNVAPSKIKTNGEIKADIFWRIYADFPDK